MRIEDFKRWHWVIIGIVAGVALGYMYSDLDPQVSRTITQGTFEEELTRKLDTGYAILSNIVVYPPRDGQMVVHGIQLQSVSRARNEWEPKEFWVVVDLPYQPQRNAPEDAGSNMTVQDYLAHVASQHDHVTYRYAWWREPKAVYSIWVFGAVAVIGGLWPTIISLLVGAGFGRRSEPDPNYDLGRFGQGQDGPAQPEKKQITQEEQDQLKAVEAELERNLKSQGGHAAGGEGGTGEEAPGQVRTLAAGPLESSNLQQQEEEKDYGGEFYPTVAHAPKKKPESQ